MFYRLTAVYFCILFSLSTASTSITQLAPNLRSTSPSAKELFEESFVREGVMKSPLYVKELLRKAPQGVLVMLSIVLLQSRTPLTLPSLKTSL